jgi:hypothetical protein
MAEGHAMQMDAFGENGVLSAPITQVRPANGITEEMHSPLASEQPSVSDHGAGNVQKIRDILFGTQMREYDTRFFKLEENLARELADIREAGRKRAETTEAYLNQEIESLRTRLKSEREERAESARQIARDLSVLGDELLKKLTALDEQLVQTERQLRLEMREASKNLSENASRVHEEAVALIDRRFQELRKGKIDRTALASMLTEVALRLNNESQTAAASA